MLDAVHMDYQASIREVLNITLDQIITFAVNDCVYSGSARDLMFNWVQLLFLNSKYAAIKQDNPNLWQDTNDPFVGGYQKASCRDIQTLEGI